MFYRKIFGTGSILLAVVGTASVVEALQHELAVFILQSCCCAVVPNWCLFRDLGSDVLVDVLLVCCYFAFPFDGLEVQADHHVHVWCSTE